MRRGDALIFYSLHEDGSLRTCPKDALEVNTSESRPHSFLLPPFLLHSRAAGSINPASKHQGLPTQEADAAALAAHGLGDLSPQTAPQKVICNFWYREKRWWGHTHF